MSKEPGSVAEAAADTIQTEVNELADSNVDSTDTELRYMAYGARLRTALRAGTRYIAYVRPSRVFYKDHFMILIQDQ